jgi:hypothetical protein
MKYVIFGFEGNSFSLAEHLIQEGQEVLVGQVDNITNTLTDKEKRAHIIEEPDDKKKRLKRYNNILPKISAEKLMKYLKKVRNPSEYFIFFESNNLFYYAEQLKSYGFQGNFPTQEDRLFEVDRDKAKEFVKQYYPQLKIVQKKTFKKISDAREFLKTTQDIWVLKSQTDSIPTFVPETSDSNLAKKQVIETLEVFKEDYEASEFFLEKKINSIIEVTPEKYYYNGKPICTTINFENKFLGSGNISMQVGCAGDLVFPIELESTINTICFPPIVDKLAQQHSGFFIWDASILIDPETDDMYFGEFCPNRPGYNSFFTEVEQAPSVHDFFELLVQGKSPFTETTVGVSLMLFNLLRDQNGQILSDASIEIDKKISSHTWSYDIYKKNEKDSLRTIGYDDHLSPVTASGKSIEEAVNNLYTYVEGFAMTRVYYRPKFDFISKEYSSSLLNRLAYCMKKKLFTPLFSY